MPARHASAPDLRRLPPFVHLSKQEIRSLGRLRSNITVPPGKVLARQGHPCLQFGIVLEGTALVTRDAREIAVLGFGQHFGGFGIVHAVPNPVTIVADTALTLEVMSVQEFWSAYTTMSALREHIDHQIDRQIATRLCAGSPVTDGQRVVPAHGAGGALASRCKSAGLWARRKSHRATVRVCE